MLSLDVIATNDILWKKAKSNELLLVLQRCIIKKIAHLKYQRQISIKWRFEKYGSYNKACQFWALQQISGNVDIF